MPDVPVEVPQGIEEASASATQVPAPDHCVGGHGLREGSLLGLQVHKGWSRGITGEEKAFYY